MLWAISFSPLVIKHYEPSKIFDKYFFIIVGKIYVFEAFVFQIQYNVTIATF